MNKLNKEEVMSKQQFRGVRHGEVALIPAKDVPKGRKLKKGDYVLAHSETGHNHVLEGTAFEVLEAGNDRVLIEFFDSTRLVHQKTHDKHRTLTIPKSILERYEMVEYFPATEAISVVKD